MQKVVILGTGGTIAGTANDPSRAWAYQAAQLSVAQLIEAVPALQPERDALWARLEAASFLTDAERRRMAGVEG